MLCMVVGRDKLCRQFRCLGLPEGPCHSSTFWQLSAPAGSCGTPFFCLLDPAQGLPAAIGYSRPAFFQYVKVSSRAYMLLRMPQSQSSELR